jgi:hypothetical protein
MGVHVSLLIGFRNRVLVLIEWSWSYVTFKRGARLITRRHLRQADVRHLSGRRFDALHRVG